MKLTEALIYLESLLNDSTKKSEIRIYKQFITITKDLLHRNFSSEELITIESELDNLQLDADVKNRKKHIRKVLNAFKIFLKEKFSLVTEGYYTAIGIGLGMSFGVAIGTAIDRSTGTAMGISIGMIVGMAIGRNLDLKAKKENRVIKTKIK